MAILQRLEAPRAHPPSHHPSPAATVIGTTLGRLAAKVQQLDQQRAALATELPRVIDTAEDMLGTLGDGVASVG